MKTRHLFYFAVLSIAACSKPNTGKVILNNNILSECNSAVQNAVVVDHVSGPVGGRRYFYASIAAYESLVPFFKEYNSLSGQMHGFVSPPKPDTTKGYCLDLISLCAHTYASQKLVYKEDSIINFRTRKLDWYKNQLPKDQYQNSINYGDSVGAAIVAWARKDSFLQTRGKDFYLVKHEPGKWEPTLPEFGDAVEPNWNKVRTSVVPAASYIKIPDPEKYSTNKNSRFYNITKQVYEQNKTQDSSFLTIAKYWDDNPNTFVHYGHATINQLKVSPTGHWLGIFSNVARQKKYNLIQTAEGFARLSAVIFDAFIVCWDTKYRTEYLRPETAIRRLIDSSWVPPIQTPSFPEYPSGHSVVSSAAATLLTSMFGNYAFIDSTEMEFGFGVRKFNNFREAANEACMSRLYGGIHFIDAIENGKKMGNQLGEYHIQKVKTRKD